MDIAKITCYGKTEYAERKKAISFYLDCMRHSEGSERDRYTNIYIQLLDGLDECSDEESEVA